MSGKKMKFLTIAALIALASEALTLSLKRETAHQLLDDDTTTSSSSAEDAHHKTILEHQ